MGNEIDCNVFWMDPACMYPTEDMEAGTQGESEEQPQLLPASVPGAWLYNLNQTVKSTTPLAARFQTSSVSAPAIKTPTPTEAFDSAKKVVMNLYGDAGAYLDRLAHGRYVGGVDTLQVYLLELYLRDFCTNTNNPGGWLCSAIAAFTDIAGDDVDVLSLTRDICSKFDALPLAQNPELFASLKQIVDKENMNYGGGLFLNSFAASTYLLEALADDATINCDFLERFENDESYTNILKPVFEKAYGLVDAAWQTANNTEGPEDFATLEALLPSFEGRSQLVGKDSVYPTSEENIKKATDWIKAKADVDSMNFMGMFAYGTVADPVVPANISSAEWALDMSIAQSRWEYSVDEALNQVGQFMFIGLGTVAAAALAPESGGSSLAAFSAAATGGSLSAGMGLKQKWDLLQTARAFDLADAEDKLNGDEARRFAEASYQYEKKAAVVQVGLSVGGAGVLLKTGSRIATEAMVAGAEGAGGAAANENITNVRHVCDGQALETGNENCDYSAGDAAIQVLLAGGISAVTAGVTEGLLGKGNVHADEPHASVPPNAVNNGNHNANRAIELGDVVLEEAANNNDFYASTMDMPVLGTGTDGLPLSHADQPYAMGDKPKGPPTPQRPTREATADWKRRAAERKQAGFATGEGEPSIRRARPAPSLARVLTVDDKVEIDGEIYHVLSVDPVSGEAMLNWGDPRGGAGSLFATEHSLLGFQYDPVSGLWFNPVVEPKAVHFIPKAGGTSPVVTAPAPSAPVVSVLPEVSDRAPDLISSSTPMKLSSRKPSALRSDTLTISEARTSPPIGHNDTIMWNFDLDEVASLHNPDGAARFIDDAEIVSYEAYPAIHNERLDRVPYAITADGRHVIQQQGQRGCVAAAVAMLVMDNKKKPDMEWVRRCNLADSDLAVKALKRAGLSPVRFDVLGRTLDEKGAFIEAQIRERGSSLFSMSSEIGAHEIVLDYFSMVEDRAIIRDPFHGWSIEITAQSILQRIEDCTSVMIQIKP